MKRRKLGNGVDHYALLQVSPDADLETIKHAYHRLALKYHPDRNKGNELECETRFKELAAAYAVLSDPEKRSAYDSHHRFFQSSELREAFNQFLATGSTTFADFFEGLSQRNSFSYSSSSSSSPSSSSSTNSNSPTSPFSSFSFNKTRTPTKGQNLRTTLKVTFNESVYGCTKTIALKTLCFCTICQGHGYPLEVQHTSCSSCNGSGTYSQRSSLLTINTTCATCEGKGVLVEEESKCKYCDNGRVHQTKELRIEVPAGVMKNMRKIYEGEGDVGEYGGVPGDLIVIFDVEESPVFKRDGDDVTCEVPITFFQAALGDHIEVPGLYGSPLRVTIPPGTQPNEVLCLENEGFVNIATKKRGKMYIRISLIIPKTLTLKQTELLFYTQQNWDAADNKT